MNLAHPGSAQVRLDDCEYPWFYMQLDPPTEMVMQVLFQKWDLTQFGRMYSISKDQAQYEGSVSKIKNSGDGAPIDTPPVEAEIPDASDLAISIQEDTVFLFEDELIYVIFPSK